jgi:prepilin-type N-terminal cleavage/methylation domain-containing protein
MKREGFSLIELVLAIVIIAISLMSIPLMLQQSSKSDSFALVQESILAARTKMGNILSFKWDENSTDTIGSMSVIRALDVTNGASDLNRSGSGIRRRGHVFANLRRRMFDTPVYPTSAIEGGLDDVDDFHGQSVVVSATVDTNLSSLDYLDVDLNLSTQVSYLNINSVDYNNTEINVTFDVTQKFLLSSLKSTNIKMIELTATASGGRNQSFLFRSFTCNIGQSRLYEREK